MARDLQSLRESMERPWAEKEVARILGAGCWVCVWGRGVPFSCWLKGKLSFYVPLFLLYFWDLVKNRWVPVV